MKRPVFSCSSYLRLNCRKLGKSRKGGEGNWLKIDFEKLKDDVHYLIVAHCKYKDMSMYDRALKQFQEDINYGQLEE